MMGRARHLHDDLLYECYLADRGGEPVALPAAAHLSDCAACGARYTELTKVLNAVRAEGAREADALFTPEHLYRQREQVLRRVEHLSRSARVISFPGRVTRHIAGASTRVAPRWLAAAAAAGLFVGVAVGGRLYEPGGARSATAARASKGQPTGARLAPLAGVSESLDDDRFLMELELALERPRTRELQPFDALMPRVREIRSQVP